LLTVGLSLISVSLVPLRCRRRPQALVVAGNAVNPPSTRRRRGFDTVWQVSAFARAVCLDSQAIRFSTKFVRSGFISGTASDQPRNLNTQEAQVHRDDVFRFQVKN
jgi:hypothetical protein